MLTVLCAYVAEKDVQTGTRQESQLYKTSRKHRGYADVNSLEIDAGISSSLKEWTERCPDGGSAEDIVMLRKELMPQLLQDS